MIGAGDTPGGEEDYPKRTRRNLERAIEILARVSFGDYGVAIDLDAEDEEFVELFAGLSLLQDDLRAARAEVDRSRRDLERQVRERTAALDEAVRGLQASESMYRSLVETSPDPIVLTGPEAQMLMVNRAFLRVFCIERAEAVLGRSLLESLAPADRARGARCWQAHECPGTVQTEEFEFLRGDESRFVGQVRSSVVCDDSSVRHGVLCIIQDVTEQRRREDHRLRADKLDSLGTLAGGIAHDFNNTLATITSSLFLAAERVREDAQAHELLLGAMDAAFRATTLTRQLLTFSKGGAPVKTCIYCGDLVRRAVDFCLRGSSIEGSVDVIPDLWPVEVDEGQLEQALGNLVINAKQAMPNGGRIEVRVENAVTTDPDDAAAAERRYVCISVRDEGIGIPREYRRRIYDPYFTTKEAGSGLGLATAYSVVRRHGGLLRCDSEPGRGSTFHVLLPAADRTPVPAAAVAPPPQSGRGRILIMDDDALVLETTAKLLEHAGYETVQARSGTEALEIFAAEQRAGRRFDATIMDLTVPGGDGGRQTVGKVLELDSDARVIVSSGYSDDPVLASCRDYGFCGALVKPFRLEDVVRVLDDATGTRPR